LKFQTFFSYCGPGDVAAEHFEFGAFPRLAINGRMK
jgi:hypothetical protein